MMMRLMMCLALPLAALSCPCPANEICLRNRTCHCPFFRLGGACVPRRFQTTVNTTLESLYAARHLLGQSPMLLTIDSTNYEAMQALGATMASVGTVVTSAVVDSLDALVGGEPSATMEVSALALVGTKVQLTVTYRLPDVDFFFFYMHFGSSAPPCPPFDAIDSCCRGAMGPEFRTAGVDCSTDPIPQLDAFVRAWGGEHAGAGRFTMSIDLAQIPSVVQQVYRFGVGMVVFGRLAQNTESRVEVQVKPGLTVASSGFFQYSFVESVHLQLEAYGPLVFARMVVKASGVTSVDSLRYAISDGGEFLLPSCASRQYSQCGHTAVSCDVVMDADFVEVVVPLINITASPQTVLVYALLTKGSSLTRVLAKTDGTVLQHCHAPVDVNARTKDSFYLEVLQRGRTLYTGPAQLVNLTDVALLTLRLHPLVNDTTFRFDNVSVVYSLVPAERITALMAPSGRVTPELEALCEGGSVCIIETLLRRGVCQSAAKCEWQGTDLVVMPLYPWKGTALAGGAFTVMACEITEGFVAGVLPRRRLLGGLLDRFFR